MNLKDLSKQQQQYLLAGVLGVGIVIAILYFGFTFSSGAITNARNELDALTKKIDSADRALARRSRTGAENMRVAASLRDYLLNNPPENYYAASEVIYPKAKTMGLEIESIDEVKIRSDMLGGAGSGDFKFESYTIKVTARGGYESAKSFLRMLSSDYPLARVTGIELSVGQTPESHNVLIFVQWPSNFAMIAKKLEKVASLTPEQLAAATQPEVKPSAQVSSVEPEPAPVAPVKTIDQPAPVVASVEPQVQPPPSVKPEPSLPVRQPEPLVAPVEPLVQVQPVLPVSGIEAPVEVKSGKYIATKKSADKLAELLNQRRQSKPSTSSLGSFLDGFVEDANEK